MKKAGNARAILREIPCSELLNIGPIPTSKLNRLQPHEGSIIGFQFRSRAYQVTEERPAKLWKHYRGVRKGGSEGCLKTPKRPDPWYVSAFARTRLW